MTVRLPSRGAARLASLPRSPLPPESAPAEILAVSSAEIRALGEAAAEAEEAAARAERALAAALPRYPSALRGIAADRASARAEEAEARARSLRESVALLDADVAREGREAADRLLREGREAAERREDG